MFSLTVEGAPVHQTPQTIPCATPTTNPSPNNHPFYKPTGSKKESTFNVKANMNKLPSGKVEFDRLEQTHISTDDWSANVNTVTNAVQSKWGSDYIVVTGDGLEVDNSSGTDCGLPSLC